MIIKNHPQESLGGASDVLTVSANNKATKLSKPLVFVIMIVITIIIVLVKIIIAIIIWNRAERFFLSRKHYIALFGNITIL